MLLHLTFESCRAGLKETREEPTSSSTSASLLGVFEGFAKDSWRQARTCLTVGPNKVSIQSINSNVFHVLSYASRLCSIFRGGRLESFPNLNSNFKLFMFDLLSKRRSSDDSGVPTLCARQCRHSTSQCFGIAIPSSIKITGVTGCLLDLRSAAGCLPGHWQGIASHNDAFGRWRWYWRYEWKPDPKWRGNMGFSCNCDSRTYEKL